MTWAICASLVSVRSGSVNSHFLNFDDKHDDIIWSLILFSILFPYSQYCASCCNRVMYCSIDSFSSCLAARNIDLSNGIFFLMQKCWSSASSDVLYSVPSRSSLFIVSYMSYVSWPTICSNKAFWRASSLTPDARMKYWNCFFYFDHLLLTEFWSPCRLKGGMNGICKAIVDVPFIWCIWVAQKRGWAK